MDLGQQESDNPLEIALRITNGDRAADYGPPKPDFLRLGKLWGALLGVPPIPPDKVGLMLVVLKVNREWHKHKADNIVDIAGYANTVWMVVNDHSEYADEIPY